MATRPKTFTAVKEFSCASFHYKVGDEVTEPFVLNTVLGFGEQFVVPDTKRTRKAATPEHEEGA